MMRSDERCTQMRWLVLLLVLAVIGAAQPARADSPADYYSLHRESQQVFYRGDDGSYYTEYRSGFQGTFDLTDPKVLCGKETGPCDGVEAWQRAIRVEDRLVYRFKVFVPPGTTFFQVMLYLSKLAQTATVSRFGQPPTGDYDGYQYADFPIDSDEGGTIEQLTAADYLTRNSGGHTKVAEQHQPPVGEGGWLYVKVFSFDGLVPGENRYTIHLDVASVLAWYQGVDWEAFNAAEYGTDVPTCVDMDGDGYGAYCASGPDCNDNDGSVHPGVADGCNGVDDDCDGTTDEDCDTCTDRDGDGYGEGCTAGSDCDDQDAGAHPGATEICDGDRDEDCDGLTDQADGDCEGCTDGDTRACYDGPAGTEDVGPCQGGLRTCAAGQWGQCLGQVIPAPEDCDDELDNDCDGMRDGADLECGPCSDGEESPCYTGPLGSAGVSPCHEGRALCMLGYYLTCQDEVTPVDEECGDEVDNDCDGLTDGQDRDCDDCTVGDEQPCYDGRAGTAGVGACSEGVKTCGPSGWGVCEGQVLPVGEVCDDLVDNDCDGATDMDDQPACVEDRQEPVGDCGCAIRDRGSLADPALPLLAILIVMGLARRSGSRGPLEG